MTWGRVAEGRAAPPSGDAARPGAWATVLVVDDEIPALDELTYLLRAMPPVASVHAARSPSEALRSLQERRYDVIFLDVRMPSLNGIELANVLGRFASPPAVVFVTAYEEYAVRAFDIGACDYLLKPVSRTRLSTALDRGEWPTMRGMRVSAEDKLRRLIINRLLCHGLIIKSAQMCLIRLFDHNEFFSIENSYL